MPRSAIKCAPTTSLKFLAVLWYALSLIPLTQQSWFAVSAAQAATSLPDMVVSSLSNPPASAIAGTTFSVTDTTGNSGSANANASTTRYRLSLDNVITGPDALLTGTRSVPTLKKNSSSTGTVTVTIPSTLTPGTYYLGACADDLAVIAESSETNNCRASTTTIIVTGPPTITSLSATSGPRGMPITISGANFGAIKGTSTVKFNNCTIPTTSWSDTSIVAPASSGCGSGPVVVTVSGVPSNGITFTETYAPRVNAGSNSGYTDTSGKFWAADDVFYSPSGIWGLSTTSTSWGSFTTTDPITNTNDPVLFQSERYGNFGFTFDLPNGRYDITLYFAEIYFTGPNQRLLSVNIEGVPVLTNYDIFADVGRDVATSKTFPGILVQDGQLNIDFIAVADNAKVSAIQILSAQPSKLGISSINNGTPPTAGVAFPIIVQSQDTFGNPVNVSSATGVNITLQSGTGNLTGTLTGTIPAGSNQVTLSNLNYSKAENGVILRATKTSGDNLSPGDSASFAVVANTATKLGFITQPGNTSANNALPGPPIVAVQDSLGNTVTSSTAQITVAIGTNPGGGSLSGTAQRNAVAGTGVFADLRISQPGNGYTLTASSPGLTGASSASFNLVAGGTISGTVTRNGSGAPIGGASIEAFQSGVLKRSASTNGSGSYAMMGLPVGTYDVRVNASGYVSQTQNGASVTGGGTTTANFSLTAATPTAGIIYIYDKLQRLKSVIDPVGEAASYAYDAVGNLLSITRNNSSQTSIIDFNPDGGAVNSGVTIFGTGFSATPSQNSVTFNGVAATVISSTLTQIVTTVPTAATTGPIAVTSPAGSATSSSSFTVTGQSSGSPSIAGFSPAIGSIGGTLTIDGTNFDTTAVNNEVRINGALVYPTTATPTSLSVTIPGNATSGKISVSTASGTAVSSQIFFVPPSPYSATDLEPPLEASIGGASFTTTIGTAGKIAIAVFYGTSGQLVELGLNATDLGTVGTEADYHIYGPGAIDIIQRGTYNVNPKFTLPTTGYYTLALDPSGSLTGYATWTLSEPVNGGVIVIDGNSATATTSRVGQTARFTFDASAGQFASLGVVTTGGMGGGELTIFRPDNISFYYTGYVGTGTNPHMTLPMTGTYKVVADPGSTGVGGITLTLSSEVNGGEMFIDGDPGAVTIGRDGQRARLTFNNTVANGIVSFAPVSWADAGTYYSIQDPNGNFVVNDYYFVANTNYHMNLQNTGIHTILLDPGGTGDFSVILSTEVDGGSISINGAPGSVGTTRIGQRGKLTFNGLTGQAVTTHFTNNTASWIYAYLVSPSGTTLASASTPNTSLDLPQQTLPADGVYTIYFDPVYATTGSVNVSITSP